MGDFIDSFNYDKDKNVYHNCELQQLIFGYFKEHVHSVNDFNSFAANLSTYASFVYDDLKVLQNLIICACCNKYGDDKGTVRTIDLENHILIFPNNFFISDVSLIMYENGVRPTTVHDFSCITDELISKYNIDINSICETLYFSYGNRHSKKDIERIINELK